MAYLIDTNHASAFMEDQEPLTGRIVQMARKGERFYLCMTVVGELYYAAYAGTKRQYNLTNLRRLLTRIAVLDFDQAAAEEYGRIKAELKAKGRPIPGTDAQIAAIARLHGLTVLSADRHLRFVDGLPVENWFR